MTARDPADVTDKARAMTAAIVALSPAVDCNPVEWAANVIANSYPDIRYSERAYIARMIRENAADLVLFAGGRTPPLDLLAWILELPPSTDKEPNV